MTTVQGITGTDDVSSAPLFDMGVHAIDAATSLLGPAHSVSARHWAARLRVESALLTKPTFGIVLYNLGPGGAAARRGARWRRRAAAAHAVRGECEDRV